MLHVSPVVFSFWKRLCDNLKEHLQKRHLVYVVSHLCKKPVKIRVRLRVDCCLK